MKKFSFIKTVLLVAVLAVWSCGNKTDQKQYSELTNELITIVESNPDLKAMLIKSIDMAKAINPNKNTNPAQSLEEYYEFIEWSTKAMPWSVIPGQPHHTLFEKIDQSLDFFYFILDQPLPELEGKGYYYNTLQYVEPLRSWLVKYAKTWGQYLDTPESWTEEYYKIALSDKRFGLQNGWYEDPSNWKSFNDFFARHLKSPDMRPIADPNDAMVIVAPADSKPQGVWAIDGNSDILQKEGVVIKSSVFNSVNKLLGPDTKYRDAFAGGTLTHSFLDVNDYHRYHFPVTGTIKEINIIAEDDAAGGITIWDPDMQKYVLHSDTPGWQTIETRGCVIVETKDLGLVALLPIGMSQVSSVNFENNLKVGDEVKKGDMLGYFLFGGSDFVILFQKGLNFEIDKKLHLPDGKYEHTLMGEKLGDITKK